MNSNISLFVFFFFFAAASVAENSEERILKKAILANGFKSPEDMYVAKDRNLATVGKLFFQSKNLSLNGRISCATCHISDKGSSDGIPNAAGVQGYGEGEERLRSGAKIVPRNTLALWGVGSKDFKTFFWDGRIDFSGNDIVSQFGNGIPSKDPLITAVHLPVVEIRETLEEDDFVLAHKQESTDSADAVYKAILNNLKNHEKEAINELLKETGKEIGEIEFIDVARSIASFIRNEFRIRNTPLNSFIKGKKSLTKKQIKGGLIFYGKGNCISCHSGSNFTNQNFYTVPFPQLGFGKNGFGIDYGRYNATFNPKDLYKFRAPSLYNNGLTAPYGHSGSVPNLYSSIRAHFDPLSLVDLSKYNSHQRFQFYKYLAKSDTVDKVKYISNDEIQLLIDFLGTMNFD